MINKFYFKVQIGLKVEKKSQKQEKKNRQKIRLLFVI